MRLTISREDGVIISTVKVKFLDWYGKYETAVSIDGSEWRILERYNTIEDAAFKHAIYENMSKEKLMNFDYIG